jgi:hypothetical protein
MMNAEHAARALGVDERNLSLEQIYMPHIFGVGGGPAILRAYADNPNTLVSDVHIRVRGKIREAVRPVDYYNNGGHELGPYEQLTVGQLIQFMRERNFERRESWAPDELRPTLVARLAGNPGSGDYSPPPVYAEAPSRTPTPTRVADAGGEHRSRTSESTGGPHVQTASYKLDEAALLNLRQLSPERLAAFLAEKNVAPAHYATLAANYSPGPSNGASRDNAAGANLV